MSGRFNNSCQSRPGVNWNHLYNFGELDGIAAEEWPSWMFSTQLWRIRWNSRRKSAEANEDEKTNLMRASSKITFVSLDPTLSASLKTAVFRTKMKNHQKFERLSPLTTSRARTCNMK